MMSVDVPALPEARPRSERLLPPAITMLVFAMVATAILGFAYIGSQQQALGALRADRDALHEAVEALQRTDAAAAHVLNGDSASIAQFFREMETLKARRPATLDRLDGLPAALDTLQTDWTDAVSLAAVGRNIDGRAVLAEQHSRRTVEDVQAGVARALAASDAQLGQYDNRIQLGTLAVLVLQVLGGTLALAGMYFAFRLSAREAEGRLSALKSADTSRQQVARLFEMADVLQSATDYGDANHVLTATAAELLPGLAGALYVFNNSRDRLVLSTTWGPTRAEHVPATIPPDQCWALKRGKRHLNRPDGAKLCCEHHSGDDTVLELPMIARGEIMGLFRIAATGADAEARLDAVAGLASALADGMSLALANMALREKLRNQALRDPLTGLYNRRYMEDSLQRFVRLADRENRDVSIVMVDLDHFKRLNDEHGHAFGDSVLRDTALTLVGSLRETDIVCRYGGEELVVILPDCNLERAAEKAEMLRARVAALSENHNAEISASFGVAALPYTSSTASDLLAAADAALYKAKQNGRNQVTSAPTRPFQLQRLEDDLVFAGEMAAAE